MKTIDNIERIEKEKIAELEFSRKEVLGSKEEIQKRTQDLKRAQSLGNLLRHKVKITFEDAKGKVYQVETTIWAVGTHFIVLKCSNHLPINCIVEIV